MSEVEPDGEEGLVIEDLVGGVDEEMRDSVAVDLEDLLAGPLHDSVDVVIDGERVDTILLELQTVHHLLVAGVYEELVVAVGGDVDHRVQLHGDGGDTCDQLGSRVNGGSVDIVTVYRRVEVHSLSVEGIGGLSVLAL